MNVEIRTEAALFPVYGLLQAFFIEKDPHSGTEIGERDIMLSVWN
jgi:hypothetical protein